MKRQTNSLAALGLALMVAMAPAFAQRGRSPSGPPAGKGSASAPGVSSSSHGSGASNHGASAMANSSPSKVLSHNTAIAGKINTLTGQDAQTACSGFKNLGQCVAAAHVAKNLNIPGGFAALRDKMTGPNAESLGKAIHELKPEADAKAEAKKAKKQADDDLKESSS